MSMPKPTTQLITFGSAGERLEGGLICRAFADDDVGLSLMNYMTSGHTMRIFEATALKLEFEVSVR